MIGAGTTVGSYTIIREIVRGHTGLLFLAEHQALRQAVVVKLLAPELSREDLALQFFDNLRRAGAVGHPGIAPVLDFGVHPEGSVYVVLDLRDGQTLASHLDGERERTPFVLRMGAAVARALAAAHSAGVIHGGLAPECVYLPGPGAPDPGEARLFDFGIGKLIRAAEDLARSPRALERAEGTSDDDDTRTDIYGLGSILYEALCGHQALTLAESPAPPSKHAPGVTPGLDALILAMLSKLPEQRPQEMTHVASTLELFADDIVASNKGASGVGFERKLRASRESSLRAEEPAPTTRHIDENVQFTVRRPKVVPPERWQKLLVFAHLAQKRPDASLDEPDPVEEVERQSEQMLGAAAPEFTRTTTDSKGAVPEKGELTIVPLVPGVEFNPQKITFLWLKPVHGFSFDFRASAELDGKTARGAVHVFLGPMILADIAVAIPIDARRAEAGRTDEQARPYRKIFASYSHKDRAIVDGVKNHVGSLGDRYLMDCVDLRAGEVWTEGIARLIKDADVFQLFWSWNALRSPYVRREWEYALSLGGRHVIRPTYWEEPLPEESGLPPEPLKKLHFQRISIAADQQPHPAEVSKQLRPAPHETTLSAAASSPGDDPSGPPAPRPRALRLGVPAAALSLVALVVAGVYVGTPGKGAGTGSEVFSSRPPVDRTVPPSLPPATVRIDVRGVAQGTSVKVDGVAAELPLTVRRGEGQHQIVLEEPAKKGKQPRTRTLVVDAVKDVDLSVDDFVIAEEAHRKEPGSRTSSPRKPHARPHKKRDDADASQKFGL